MNAELARRLGTAALLIPAVVAAILLLDTPVLAAVLGFAVLLGAMEWQALAGWRHPASRYLLALALFAGMAGIGTRLADTRLLLVVAAVAFAWWLVALWLILRHERGAGGAPAGAAAAMAGLLVLLPTWSSLLFLHARPGGGPWILLGLLALVWLADSGAYFAGRRWGRRRLAPRVSPGKTLAGCYGALALAVPVAALVALLGGLAPARAGAVAALAAVTVIFSIVGDLFESLMKRQQNLKDSGSLLPGHGGILDRIDSLTAAAPVFALGLSAVTEGA